MRKRFGHDNGFCFVLFKATLVIVLIGCGSSEWHPCAPSVTHGVGVDVIRAIDIDEEEHGKIERAIALLAQVLNDETFWADVAKGPDLQEVQKALQGEDDVEATSLGPGQTYAWNVIEQQGKRLAITNAEIVRLLRLAHEPGGSRDQVVEFAIRRNRRPWALWCGRPFYFEIGHREAPNIIMTQDCHMSGMSAPELAGHWLHEYMHMLGFDHAYSDNPARISSVPYFVGERVVRRATEIDTQVARRQAPAH